MTPEQKARQQIDRQLEQAGWIVQDYRMNITAGLGVAVREFPLTTGHADYMLYADAMAIGVVEAKPKGHTLTGVETQSGKYLDGLPAGLPHHRLPLFLKANPPGPKDLKSFMELGRKLFLGRTPLCLPAVPR